MTSKKITCQNLFDFIKKSPKLMSQLLFKFDNKVDDINRFVYELEKINVIFPLNLSPKQKIILSEYAKNIPMTIENKIYVYTPNRYFLIKLLNKINHGIMEIYNNDLSSIIVKINEVMGRIESFSRILNPEMNRFHYSALIKTMLLTNSLDMFKDFDVEYGIPATKLQNIINDKILMKLPLDFTLYPVELEDFDDDYNNFIVNILLFFNKMYKLLVPSEIFGREILSDGIDTEINAEVFDIDMSSDLGSISMDEKAKSENHAVVGGSYLKNKTGLSRHRKKKVKSPTKLKKSKTLHKAVKSSKKSTKKKNSKTKAKK